MKTKHYLQRYIDAKVNIAKKTEHESRGAIGTGRSWIKIHQSIGKSKT